MRISRYNSPFGPEAEAEPGSRGRVMRNRLGITRKTEMDRAEYQALALTQQRYFRIVSADTRFDAALIRAMHRDWLGDIYVWAGEYRTIELSKGNMAWPPAFRVAENMDRFSRGRLATYTPCRPGSLPEVAHALAAVHAELLLIHPFCDGNGRVARLLADLMAGQAGFPPPVYRFEGRRVNVMHERYINAVYSGYLGRLEPLADFFAEAIELAG